MLDLEHHHFWTAVFSVSISFGCTVFYAVRSGSLLLVIRRMTDLSPMSLRLRLRIKTWSVSMAVLFSMAMEMLILES